VGSGLGGFVRSTRVRSVAHSGDREQLDRLIVNTQIGHREHPDR
jgi:hypothetical protein